MLRDGSNDDECVLGILKNSAAEVVNKRVEEKAITRSLEKNLLEHIYATMLKRKGRGGHPAVGHDSIESIAL
jgi:hypothetical protein